MKNRYIYLLLVIISCIILIFPSCQKDTDGNPQYKSGKMAFDSLNIDSAGSGKVLVLSGKNLGQVRSIVFEKNKVPVNFMSTLNTDSKLIFRVPDSAYGGNQNIIITNVEGNVLQVPFKVLALPGFSAMFPTDFQEGTIINITGNNLEDVSNVVFEGTAEKITIVSQSRKQLVIKMPATTLTRSKLTVTNSSGKVSPAVELINVDKALTVFSDQLDNGFKDIGWSGTYVPSAEYKITGETSLKATYKAAWAVFKPNNTAGVSVQGMNYFSFWAKGDEVDKNITLYVNGANSRTITIPAKQWSYFRYELAKDYPTLKTLTSLSFQCGADASNNFYFDNIMFFK